MQPTTGFLALGITSRTGIKLVNGPLVSIDTNLFTLYSFRKLLAAVVFTRFPIGFIVQTLFKPRWRSEHVVSLNSRSSSIPIQPLSRARSHGLLPRGTGTSASDPDQQ